MIDRSFASDRRSSGVPLRVGVFVSGGGSNLQALLDRFPPEGDAAAQIALVVASRSGIGALERAVRAGVAAEVVEPRRLSSDEHAERLLGMLDRHGVEFVVLAGYMHLVPSAVVARFHGRMINIHPALLPGFGGQGLYGLRVHRAVLAADACVTGVTVHLVDERYDTGPIIAQWPVPVLEQDTPESLAARVLATEHRLLPAVVQAFAAPSTPSAETAGPLTFQLARDGGVDEKSLRSMIRLRGAPESTLDAR